MENTGYVRHVDDLGRFVIPSKLRKKLYIKAGDELPIYLHEADGEQYLCLRLPNMTKDKILVARDLLRELDIPLPEELDFE